MSPRILLPLSLSANVFLAVIVATFLLRGDPGPPRPPAPAAIMEAVAATLPPADAVHLRQAFDAHLTDLDVAQGVMRQIPDRVSAALAEPEFSETALREAFAAGRQARSRMDLAIEAALVQAASRMSLEGRQRLSEWRPPRPGRH